MENNRRGLYNLGMSRWEYCQGCDHIDNCEVDGACWDCFCTEGILEDIRREEE